MSAVQEIEAAIRRLSPGERAELLSDLPALLPELDGDSAFQSGLVRPFAGSKAKTFETAAEDLGVFSHLNYDNIGDLLEVAEKASRQ